MLKKYLIDYIIWCIMSFGVFDKEDPSLITLKVPDFEMNVCGTKISESSNLELIRGQDILYIGKRDYKVKYQIYLVFKSEDEEYISKELEDIQTTDLLSIVSSLSNIYD